MTDDKLTTSFSARVKHLDQILIRLEELQADNRELLQRWRQTLTTVNDLRLNFSLPVTCIGPVKSGKSTLVNTLAGADLLPTGAGITTSFPTTLSADNKFSAEIKLQPENIVNEMFARAANLLLNDGLKNPAPSLFVTDERLQIEKLLNSYQTSGNLTRHGIFNESYRLLKNMTTGAQEMSQYYHNSELKLKIEDPLDPVYRSFIRNEAFSPFLSEIHLKAPLKLLPPYLSLRDLPGLDTPNPSHQSIIIQQLSESPALIYVISSRIGLRQADYQLLEHLHNLGLHERLLFVINIDLDVHDDAHELNLMIRRCSDELDELGFTQPKYAFSALALFWSREEIAATLNPTCKRRLHTWQEEQEKLKISASGATRFLDRLLALGENESSQTLLRHSDKRLAQVFNNTRRLIKNELNQLAQKDHSLNSDLNHKEDRQHKIDAVLHETERIIGGVCDEVEQFCHKKIARWLDDPQASGLRRQLYQIIDSYQAPFASLPEKSRNPLTPIRIIDNHFQLTVPAQLQEKATVETIRFLETLHVEINQRLLNGCTPLFIICENFVGEIEQNELPLPVKIGGEIPFFTLKSEVEKRFAIVEKIGNLAQLLSRKIVRLRRRLSLAQEYSQQITKAAHKELPRWLNNYREQLKFALIRHHINECRELLTTFFTDLLASTQTALANSDQLNNDQRASTAKRMVELEEILGHLEKQE